MAISLASLERSSVLKPPRILIHGVHGVGKTTFAADAPNPVFIVTEDGLGTLQVDHFPLAKTFDEVMDRRLGVMDLSAIDLCRQNNIPIIVFNLKIPGHMRDVVRGGRIGTVVSAAG